MPETIRVDAVIVGEGLGAWVAARELERHGRTVAVVPAGGPGADLPLLHRPVGPLPSYVEAIRRWGKETARQVWEVFREDADELARLCAELRVAEALTAPGGFVLARTRAEALLLAEGEDLLRDDGFSGEFLDQYLLETRFDVRGVLAAYWAVDDVVADEHAIVAALRAAAGGVVQVEEPVQRLHVDRSGVLVVTSSLTVQAEWLFLATAIDVPLVDLLPGIFHAQAWSRSEVAVEGEVRLPCPARSFDGRVAWEREESLLLVTAEGPGTAPPLEWGGAALAAPSGHRSGTASVSGDQLPVLGRVPGTPLMVVSGGQGPGSPCVVAGARWVVESALTGRDPVPAWLRPARFG